MTHPDRYQTGPTAIVPITERAPSLMDPEQLQAININTLQPRELGAFDTRDALNRLDAQEGRPFVGVDIGGDTICSHLYVGTNGLVAQVPEAGFDYKSNNGDGYLPVLEATALYANQGSVPVGISYAGPVDGTRVIDGPNVKILLSELTAKYGRNKDFKQVIPSLKVLANDAVSGLAESAVNLTRTDPAIKNIIYLINGSGIGGAVLLNGTMIATEVGHTEVATKFNRWQREKPCGMGGNEYTCIENVAASKAGIEAAWFTLTGEELDGRGIEQRYLQGDQLAADLYENSAELVSNAIFGLAQSFDIDLSASSTAVVGHGGSFKFPGYARRVQQILAYNTKGETPLVTTTYSFSPNACLDGAATLAAIAA